MARPVDVDDQPVFSITGRDGTEASLTWREGRVEIAGAHTTQLQRAIATMAHDLQGILVDDDGRARPLEWPRVRWPEEPQQTRRPVLGAFELRIGFVLGALVGGPAAYGLVVLKYHAWASCGVIVNDRLGGLFILFTEGSFLWAASAVIVGVVFAAVAGARWRRRALGGVAGLLALVPFAWLWCAGQVTPAHYPEDEPAELVRDITPSGADQPAPVAQICPSNIPPWWPSWIPV